MSPNGEALCEGGIFEKHQLHLCTVDYCLLLKISTSAPLLQSACYGLADKISNCFSVRLYD
jgi:hypothetical protein